MTEQVAVEQEQPKQKKGFGAWLDKVFKLSENGTNVKTEVFAGITTFFAMCYIVIVNPNQITGFNQSGLPEIWNAVYVGGLIAAIIGTLLMAFLAKKPFAQAAGMGLNSFFNVVFIGTATGGEAINRYGAGLAVILISGVIFLILSFTGLRKYIATALPDCLKKAIPAGIGLFITLLGLKNSFIVQGNQFTFVQLADCTKWVIYNDFGEIAGGAAPVLAAFLGFIAIAVFAQSKVKFLKKASVILGILVSSVLYYLLTGTYPTWNGMNVGQTFADFGKYGFAVFNAESWTTLFDGHTIGNVFTVIMLVVTYCLVDMFDTLGTLYGTCSQANMLDENGNPERLDQCLMCDSIGTVAGACLGTSTITTFVESASGVAEGGRTGLTSLVTAIGFTLCLFLSPVASLIPSVATAPALIYVGVLMLKSFANVDMSDLRSAVPAYLALVMMPLTYSISNGIGIGAIAYVLITLFTGKFTKKDIVITVIAALFCARFALVSM